jgi:hypothetical protein
LQAVFAAAAVADNAASVFAAGAVVELKVADVAVSVDSAARPAHTVIVFPS